MMECRKMGVSVAEVTDIMLVESRLSFRQALAVLLDAGLALLAIQPAGSLAEARERAGAVKDLIGIVVVDVALSDGDATTLISEQHQASPGVKVGVRTASAAPEMWTRAVLLKAFGREEIPAAV